MQQTEKEALIGLLNGRFMFDWFFSFTHHYMCFYLYTPTLEMKEEIDAKFFLKK